MVSHMITNFYIQNQKHNQIIIMKRNAYYTIRIHINLNLSFEFEF